MMIKIAAGQFKARCLKLMDDVQKTHEEVVITKYGRPIAKLVPIKKKDVMPLFGFLKGSVAIHDDIILPTGEEWESDG